MQKDIGFPRNCIDDKYFELKVQKQLFLGMQ